MEFPDTLSACLYYVAHKISCLLGVPCITGHAFGACCTMCNINGKAKVCLDMLHQRCWRGRVVHGLMLMFNGHK